MYEIFFYCCIKDPQFICSVDVIPLLLQSHSNFSEDFSIIWFSIFFIVIVDVISKTRRVHPIRYLRIYFQYDVIQ